MLINIFLLRIMNSHQSLDRLDDALRIAHKISIDISWSKPFRNTIEQTREMLDFTMGTTHRSKTMRVTKETGQLRIDR